MSRFKTPIVIGAIIITLSGIIIFLLQIPTTKLSIENTQEPKSYLVSTNNPEITSKVTEYNDQKIVVPLVNNEVTDLKIKSDFTELSKNHTNLDYEATFKSPTLFSIYALADEQKIPITYDLTTGEHLKVANLVENETQVSSLFKTQKDDNLKNSFAIENNSITTTTKTNETTSVKLSELAPYADLKTLKELNPELARTEYNRREAITLATLQTTRIKETQQKIKNLVNCSTVPCVAITFDDGPSEHTDRLLDILKDKQVQATFYVLGQEVQERPKVTQRIIEEGHTLGNHTFHHPDLAKIDQEQIHEEISKTQNIIYELTGHYPLTYRPPFGSSKTISPRYPLDEIMWSIDSKDWSIKDTNQIIESTTKDVKSGDIILYHDTYPTTVDAIPQVITTLQEKGFTLVTVEDLLVDNTNVPYQPASRNINSKADVTTYQ